MKSKGVKKMNEGPPYLKIRDHSQGLHFFICPMCDDQKEIHALEFAAHVDRVHNLKVRTGLRSLLKHINRKPNHYSIYEWDIGGLTFYEHIG
jgi:hypothetical protein